MQQMEVLAAKSHRFKLELGHTWLFVIRGTPTEVFGEIFSKYTVKQLAFEVDTEPYALKRDAEIKKLAELSGVKVVSQSSHTLYDLDRAIALNKGEAPKTYQSFCNLRKRLGEPPLPVNTPLKSAFEGKFPVEFMSERNTSTPTDEELGLAEGSYTTLYPGGESEALRRMDENLQRKEWICKFEKPETEPNSLKPSTTVLSPYLKFGCLSVRLFYHQLNQVYKNRKHTEPPVSLHGQLLWREFFYTVAYDTKDFDKMAGNRLCKQIPWGDDEQKFMAWKQGRTGYPFIDAIMRQLAREGWIHHLARHAVACFLTRGDLWISWEKGQQVFEEYLLDADWSLNAGNWLWLSASAFFHQYFRVYSPIAFGKKTDKTGEYIRKYVPELKSYPTQYIYEPWKAPIGVQKSCKCIVGVDYPNPIVDHDKARQENIEKMAKAYKANEGSSKDPPEKQPTAKKRKLK